MNDSNRRKEVYKMSKTYKKELILAILIPNESIF